MVFLFIFGTVTFSRMDPEGKLIMGFRKASSSSIMQVAGYCKFLNVKTLKSVKLRLNYLFD